MPDSTYRIGKLRTTEQCTQTYSHNVGVQETRTTQQDICPSFKSVLSLGKYCITDHNPFVVKGKHKKISLRKISPFFVSEKHLPISKE